MTSSQWFQDGLIWAQFAKPSFQTKTIPNSIPTICSGCCRKHSKFLVKLNHPCFILRKYAISKAGRNCPVSIPRGYQISWHRVNPINDQDTKPNIWIWIGICSRITLSPKIWCWWTKTEDADKGCQKTGYFTKCEQHLVNLGAQIKKRYILFYIFSLLCWRQTETVCS